MSDRIIYAHDSERRTNARAIADLAELGVLRQSDEILDLTVGPEAGFWTLWRPDHLTTNDVDPHVDADCHFDARCLPLKSNSFDVVVWDPPYAYRGTSRLASDARYGLSGKYNAADAVDFLLIDGAIQALRVARRLVLVKCQDSNVASHFRDQSGFVCEAMRKEGATVAGKLYVTAGRAQPAGKKQLNVWGYHSVLLVVEP